MRISFSARRVFVVCLFAALAIAQDYRARVQGIVTDATNAAVVGAYVTLTNINTGLATVRKTDAAGRYLFDYVLPGTYSVAVAAAGFSNFVQDNVSVLTAGDVTVNAQVKVGGVTETVTVSEAVPLLQTTTSTMTTTVAWMTPQITAKTLEPSSCEMRRRSSCSATVRSDASRRISRSAWTRWVMSMKVVITARPLSSMMDCIEARMFAIAPLGRRTRQTRGAGIRRRGNRAPRSTVASRAP